MWDLIVSVPDHCLSFYFEQSQKIGMKTKIKKTTTTKQQTFVNIIVDINIS